MEDYLIVVVGSEAHLKVFVVGEGLVPLGAARLTAHEGKLIGVARLHAVVGVGNIAYGVVSVIAQFYILSNVEYLLYVTCAVEFC